MKGGEHERLLLILTLLRRLLPSALCLPRLVLSRWRLWLGRLARVSRPNISSNSVPLFVLGVTWLATCNATFATSFNVDAIMINAGNTNVVAANLWAGTGLLGTTSPSPAFPLAPGNQCSQTFSWSSTYGNWYLAYYWYLPGGSEAGTNTPAVAPSGPGVEYFALFPNGTNNCVPFPATVINNSEGSVLGFFARNGVTEFTVPLAAGASYTYTYSCVNMASDRLNWGYNSQPPVFGSDGNGNISSSPSPTPTVGGGSTSGDGSGGGSGPQSGTNFNPLAIAYITNGPVNWGGLTNSASLVDAAGFALLHSDNQQALAALGGILQGINNVNGTDSNGFWWDGIYIRTNTAQLIAAITNNLPTGGSGGGLSNWPSDYPDSNVLMALNSHWFEISNSFGTNDFSATNAATTNDYSMTSADTNGAAAIADASSQINADGTLDAADASITGVGALKQTVPSDGAPDMSVTWSSGSSTWVIDCNPVTKFPWAFALSHAFYTWMLYVIFVTGVVDTIYKVLSDFAAAQTGRVPPMQGAGSGAMREA